MRAIGLRSQLVETGGHPLVVGVRTDAPGRPTVLVYGHYDVQPPGDRAAWRDAPFGGLIRDGRVHGRGASDDKGQLLVHLSAIRLLLERHGTLPVNVVVTLDGEEEIGSPHLSRVLAGSGPWHVADVAIVSDQPMRGPGRPALTRAMRGLVGLEVDVRRAGPELHAGQFGGVVPDAAAGLCRVVAGLLGDGDRVRAPGFWEPVAGELRASSAPPTSRPALTVTGVEAGQTGREAQATIRDRAVADLDVRIVPRQEPRRVATALGRRIWQLTPEGLTSRVRVTRLAAPVELDPASRPMLVAARALEDAFGRRPVLRRSGGTIPAVDFLHRRLGLPVVLMGFGLPDDAIHAPNESFRVATLQPAILASARFLELVGAPERRR
jgi:acetylornithine deacetylase/succinyl-diaminopimelate desuccinylase-like protein